MSRHPLTRTLGFAVLYVLATYAGRLTVMDATNLSLVWPAAGVLAVWFVVQRGSRLRWLDVLALTVITLIVNMATGASPALAAGFVVANLAQGFVVAGLVGRSMPGLWTQRPIAHPAELWHLIRAATLAAGCSAVIGTAALALTTGHWSATAAAVWLARNAVSVMIIGALYRQRFACVGTDRRFEQLAVAVVSVAAYLFAFGLLDGLPVAFALIVVTVWAGLRLHTTFVILHALVFGSAAILFTLHGQGPFAQIGSHPIRALVAQLFVGTVAVVGLALALGRDERDALVRRLRESERTARAQAHLMTTIVDAMHDGVGVVDDSGRYLLRNPAASRLLGGVTRADGTIRESSYYGLFHPGGAPLADDELPHRRVLADGGVVTMDVLIRNAAVPDGRILQISATRLPTDEGPRQAVVVVHDVTADRRHRDELRAFAGAVAHDLQNPLTTIDGWAETLHEELTGDRRARVERIQRAAARMHSLIDGLLSYATSRDAALSPEPVDLDVMVNDVAVSRLDNAAGTSRVLPRFDIGHLARVSADPVLLRQLLDNLIGNAVKYVAPGTVPHVTVTSEDAGEGMVRVAVADNGVGIPAGQHDAIFGSFHRAHTAYPGTGLGLAICKRIVERHGGAIAATDNPAGRGARMIFTLPAA